MTTVSGGYWRRLALSLPGAAADAATELLESLGAVAVSAESDGADDRFDLAEPSLEHWSETRIEALFTDDTPLAPVIDTLANVFGVDADAMQVERFADRDWERAWLEHFTPVRITEELWICPSWCEPPPQARTCLSLDPGLAFGTGTHATTHLCLSALAGMDLSGRTVLDFGCGSGILAIAALRLGARRAVACDVDPRALSASVDNARANGVDDRCQVISAEEATRRIDSGALRADLVIANILAEALVALSPTLLRALAPGGSLLLSGILDRQREQVARAYPALTFTVHSRDEWLLMST